MYNRGVNDPFSLKSRPRAPSILIPYLDQWYSLPIKKLDIRCEFNVSTAFVKVTGTWENVCTFKTDLIFCLPSRGTVTSVNIEVQKRIYDTVVIPSDEAGKLAAEQEKKKGKMAGGAPQEEKKQGQLPQDMSFDTFIPDLFRLPIQGVDSGEPVTVTVVFIEPLIFHDGNYIFHFPLSLTQDLIPPEKTFDDVISFKAVINSVSNECTYASGSHDVAVQSHVDSRVTIELTGFAKTPEEAQAALAAKAARDNQMAPPRPEMIPPNGEADGGASGAAADDPLLKKDANTIPDVVKPKATSLGDSAAALTTPAPGEPKAAANEKQSVDIDFQYSLLSDEILPTLVCEQAPGAKEGSFLLFVTPPSEVAPDTNFFSRNMVFLIDRSGSMSGDPYKEAARALGMALSKLNASDKFTIVAFDHTQEYLSPNLLEATQENINTAFTWLASMQPARGLTDINTPLTWALEILEAGENDPRVLSFCVLLTDGCVPAEREICRSCHVLCKRTRVLTFGIGCYSNWFFLKMLSNIGRGFSDVVVYSERIYQQVVRLLDMAAVPVLTNVEVKVDGVTDLAFYPHPLPDLFMGAPLTISGSFVGKMPSEVTITATNNHGLPYSAVVPVRYSDVIPVEKVFISQRLDLLTAKAWFEGTKESHEKVVELSCEESMPSGYTTMVAYERPPDQKDDNDAPNDPDAFYKPGTDDKKKIHKDKRWYRNKKTLGALAAGGVIVVGAAAFSFGDLAASLNNVPILGGLGGELGGDGCLDCCGCGDEGCDGCDCECGDCAGC